MSRRGEIVIECDSPDCQAEIVLDAKDARESGDSQAYRLGIGVLLGAEGWWTSFQGKDICPSCDAEIEGATRCHKCLVSLTRGETCGDCYGGTEDPHDVAVPFAVNH